MLFAQRWLMLAVVSSALLLIVVDMTVLYTALPALTRDLQASATEKLWIINAYQLVAAGLLLPMIGGAVLSATGLLTIQLPQWLLAASYAVLAWSVGLGFTRAVLGHALKALPTILVSIAVLIGFCAGLAWVLTQLTGIDLLSAYLATSPGGLDTVAIIAASSRGVDIGFVMALQTMRFFLVVLLGPPLARFVARQVRE